MKKVIFSLIILLVFSDFCNACVCKSRNRRYRVWFPSIKGTHSVLVPKVDHTPVITEEGQEVLNVKSDLYFTVFEDAKGEYRWNLRARNGKIIADSAEGYKNRKDCLHGIELIKTKSANAEIIGK